MSVALASLGKPSGPIGVAIANPSDRFFWFSSALYVDMSPAFLSDATTERLKADSSPVASSYLVGWILSGALVGV